MGGAEGGARVIWKSPECRRMLSTVTTPNLGRLASSGDCRWLARCTALARPLSKLTPEKDEKCFHRWICC